MSQTIRSGRYREDYQHCIFCDGVTGRTTGEDDIYYKAIGPLCEECLDIAVNNDKDPEEDET